MMIIDDDDDDNDDENVATDAIDKLCFPFSCVLANSCNCCNCCNKST